MSTITIAIADDVAEGLEQLRQEQEPIPDLATVANSAIREYLIQRGYLPSHRVLRIRPAKKGSGLHDVSVEHDRYLAE
jgi:hypothetical protein